MTWDAPFTSGFAAPRQRQFGTSHSTQLASERLGTIEILILQFASKTKMGCPQQAVLFLVGVAAIVVTASNQTVPSKSSQLRHRAVQGAIISQKNSRQGRFLGKKRLISLSVAPPTSSKSSLQFTRHSSTLTDKMVNNPGRLSAADPNSYSNIGVENIQHF